MRSVAIPQQTARTGERLEGITHEVLDELDITCPDCGDVTINDQSFSCFRESPTHITYRARIEGNSETNSSHLVSLIEKWVRSGGARIIVTQIQLTVDPHCSVAIPSLTYDMECEQMMIVMSTSHVEMEPATTMTITPDVESQPSSNNTRIIGGFMAIIIILILIITVVVVAIVIVKHRQKKKSSSVWKPEEYVRQLTLSRGVKYFSVLFIYIQV